MKPFLRKIDPLLVKIMTFLGFSTCLNSCFVGLYAPLPDYACDLSVNVTDETGNGIEGIQVTITQLGQSKEQEFGPVFTDASGHVSAYCGARDYYDFDTGLVVAKDIDGPDHGGEFLPVEYGFSTQDAPAEGKGLTRVHHKEINIVMTKK
ncbi:MAG: hypothetical protein J5808_02130 [Paludibacteraceae bacterium]|nr:hypothetical protein [Paludibacteraceae bacterium]